MESHQAFKAFCLEANIEIGSKHYEHGYRMFLEETEHEKQWLKSGNPRIKNAYSKAVENTLYRMVEWHKHAHEYFVGDIPDFICTHRRTLVWVVLRAKQM